MSKLLARPNLVLNPSRRSCEILGGRLEQTGVPLALVNDSRQCSLADAFDRQQLQTPGALGRVRHGVAKNTNGQH